jgi:cyclophilin family peptidyl-prolyl cis-trans isomerase
MPLATAADMCPAGMQLPLGTPRPDNPTCFLDVTIGGEPAGRLVFELRADKLPLTSRNFMLLAGDAMGFGYASTKMHRVIPKLFCQGGDVLLGTATDGKGGLSAIGKGGAPFADECFDYKHAGRGVLAMGNAGEAHSNQSQFFITFGATPFLDGHCVVFGQLLRGWSVLAAIEAVGQAPSGHPTSEVMVSAAGVASEGAYPVGSSNVQLYQLLGDADSMGGDIENDSTMPGLRALTIERVGELEAAHHDAVLEEKLMSRHLKLYEQMQEELDVANGRHWAASAIEMMVRLGMDDPGFDPSLALIKSEREERTKDRAVYSDKLRRWPTLRQHAATMSSLRAAAKAISKPASIARVRAAALEAVGGQAIDTWIEHAQPMAPGSRRVSPRVDPVEARLIQECYRDLLPRLDELSVAKQASRLSTGQKQWLESRELVVVASFLGAQLGPDDNFMPAAALGSSAEVDCEVSTKAIGPAVIEARRKLAELRVRQEVEQAFKADSPNADSAEAKRVQMELEALEMRGVASCGAHAKAMATVAANVMATCVSANPWNQNAPTDGEEGARYAAMHADVLTRQTPSYILKGEAALQQAHCEAGPNYAVKDISRRAKKRKLEAAAGLELLGQLQELDPREVPDALAAAITHADEAAEQARHELLAARQPRSRWKQAKTKLVGARLMYRLATQVDAEKKEGDRSIDGVDHHKARWVQELVRNAKVDQEMQEDKIAESLEDQLGWGRAKHRLYRACGERALLNDIESAVVLRSQNIVEHEVPSQSAWSTACDRMRATLTLQLADAQTRLDGIMHLKRRFSAGQSNIAVAAGHIRSRVAAAKGRAAMRHNVRAAKEKALQQTPSFALDSSVAVMQTVKAVTVVKRAGHSADEEALLLMVQERALWTETLYSNMAMLSCWQARIKADKILKLRTEGTLVAKESAHMQMFCGIVPEVGLSGDRQPWGLSIYIPALEHSDEAVQGVSHYEGTLLERMRAATLWRKHKGALSWMSRFVHVLGEDVRLARDAAQKTEASEMSRASEALSDMAMTWVDLADSRGTLQAVRLSEVVYMRMSALDQVDRADMLLRSPVRDLLTQMAAQDFCRLKLAKVTSVDIHKEFKDTRQHLATAAGVIESTFEFAAERAKHAAFGSEEARVARKLVAETAAEVERKAWEPPAAAGVVINHATACRRLLLLDAARGASNLIMPVIESAITNRDIAIDLIMRSAQLTEKTRATLEMPEGAEKKEATDALNQEAQALAHTIRNLQTPSTAQHVVEELQTMQQGAEARYSRSDYELAKLEREVASAKVQLLLLKSEERRCRAAAEAFPSLVKQLLHDLGARKLGDPDELQMRRLKPSVVQRVHAGFEQAEVEVAAAVVKSEAFLERLQEDLKTTLRSGAYRREITSFCTHTAYFVERARRVRQAASSSASLDAGDDNGIALVNGLATRVPRGSRLRPYHEYP